MKAMVSEKGQVTIPKALRDRLGIQPGDALDFEADAGRLVARKAEPLDPVDAVWGILEPTIPTDEFIDEIRGPAEPWPEP
jgi:AbrB family looped-hinge helix DNA binding protein